MASSIDLCNSDEGKNLAASFHTIHFANHKVTVWLIFDHPDRGVAASELIGSREQFCFQQFCLPMAWLKAGDPPDFAAQHEPIRYL